MGFRATYRFTITFKMNILRTTTPWGRSVSIIYHLKRNWTGTVLFENYKSIRSHKIFFAALRNIYIYNFQVFTYITWFVFFWNMAVLFCGAREITSFGKNLPRKVDVSCFHLEKFIVGMHLTKTTLQTFFEVIFELSRYLKLFEVQ